MIYSKQSTFRKPNKISEKHNLIICKQHKTIINYGNHTNTANHIKMLLDTNIRSSSNNKHRFACIIAILSEKPRSIMILIEKPKLSLNQKIIKLKCTESFTTVWGITSQWLKSGLYSHCDVSAKSKLK